VTRVDVVVLGAVVVVMGCATAQKEEARPASSPRQARAAEPPDRVLALRVDAAASAVGLGAQLSDRARSVGVAGRVAFVWGDVRPAPPGARPAEIQAGGARVRGYLVPGAHELDMGELAAGIREVVVVGCDERGLYGTDPSGPGRSRLDSAPPDPGSAEETFAFVSLQPGDLSGEVSSARLVSLLEQLPRRVRYAVLALPD
jgi:hypothetical protein